MNVIPTFLVTIPSSEAVTLDLQARIASVVKSASGYVRCGYQTRIRQYEGYKKMLSEMPLTPAEYDTAIQKLAAALAI